MNARKQSQSSHFSQVDRLRSIKIKIFSNAIAFFSNFIFEVFLTFLSLLASCRGVTNCSVFWENLELANMCLFRLLSHFCCNVFLFVVGKLK